MSTYWPILLISFALNICNAQDWNNYRPVKAAGEVPEEFTEAYIAKYKRGSKSISRSERRKTRRRKDDFYRKSEYYIDEFLRSGNVYYGDTITNYCRAVLDKVIGDNLPLKDEIKLFTVKSPVVNAAATANGIIFVNQGLIAQLETEAQLAYILSHELIHYTRKHVLDQYIEQEKIYKGEDLYRKTPEGEKLLALSTYSKSQELEADEAGYKNYFGKIGYNPRAPYQVLDILQYAYLPFDEVAFEKDFFANEHFQFPEDYFLKETNSITAADDYDDKKSSHPNLLTRRKGLSEIIPPAETGEDFLISKEAFMHCRKIARYELSHIYLNTLNYPQAIYNSYLLLREDSGNRYLRFTIAKALHALSVYHNDYKLYSVLNNSDKIEGESQQLYHLLEQLSRDEMAILAVTYSYQLHRDFPEDPYIEKLFNRTLRDLVFENKMKPEDFFRSSRDSLFVEVQEDIRSIEGNSKIAKIKRKKTVDKIGDEHYYQYAFVDFFKDDEFSKKFEEKAKEYEVNHHYYNKNKNRQRGKYDKNTALGIDAAICVTPQYLKLDQRDRDGVKFLSTAERQMLYKKHITDMASLLNLRLTMLDYKNNKHPFTTQEFNDIALINTWTGERLRHVNHDVIVSNFDYMDEIKSRYNTPYVITTGNLSQRIKENIGATVLGMVVLPYYIPFGLADLAIPDFESFNYFFLFDLNNGGALLAEYNYYNSSDNTDYMRSIMYNYLLQIASEPKR